MDWLKRVFTPRQPPPRLVLSETVDDVLRRGSRGLAVIELQKALRTLGLVEVVDGIYGPKTQAAVAKFQSAYMVTGVVDDATQEAIDRVMIAVASRSIETLPPFPVPRGLDQIEALYGAIEYKEAQGGYITITNDWAERHITSAELPVVGQQLVHKKVEPIFKSVLHKLLDEGLAELIRQFSLWCPRHKMHDPKRGLSTHSWAIACDINWADNPVGEVGTMDPAFVAVFEEHGFSWGGRWRNRDDMHFQLALSY